VAYFEQTDPTLLANTKFIKKIAVRLGAGNCRREFFGCDESRPLINIGLYTVEKVEMRMVPRGGLEPPRLAAPDFESGTSTNSITGAGVCSGKTALKQTKR
jgi:hypothetical protein